MIENNDFNLQEIKQSNNIMNNNNKDELNKIENNSQKINKIKEDKKIENDTLQITNEIKRKRSSQKFKIFHITIKTNYYIYLNNILIILCMIFFSSSIFLQFEIEKRYKIKKALKTKFGFNNLTNIIFFPINNITTFYTQLQKNLTETLINDNFFILNNKYQLISNYRLTQRRIKLSSYKYPIQPLINEKLFFPKWATNTINPNSNYDESKEDKEKFSSLFSYDKEKSYLNLGGNVLLNYIQDNNFENNINILFHKDTGSLIGDFTLYNFERKYFCSVIFINQIYDIGISTLKLKIYINHRDLYQTNWSLVRLILEGLFVLFYIIYVILFFIKIHFKINSFLEEYEFKYQLFNDYDKNNLIKINDKNKELSELKSLKSSENEIRLQVTNLNINFEKNNISDIHKVLEKETQEEENIIKKDKKKQIKKPNKLKILIQIFLSDFFLITQLLAIILQLLSIIFWIFYVFKMKTIYKDLDNSEKEKAILSTKLQNKLIELGKLLEVYKIVVILSLFFLFFQLIQIIGIISRRVNMFINTIKYAFADIFSFFIFLMIILLGFSTFSWLYYGRILKEFYTLNDSFQISFAFCLGIINSDIFYQMYQNYGAMTICYFIILIVIVRFIILKIILAILLHYFHIANNEYLKIISLDNLDNKNLSEIKQRPLTKFIYWYSHFINGIFNFFICKKIYIKDKNKKDYIISNEKYESFNCKFSEEKIKILCPEMLKVKYTSNYNVMKRINALSTNNITLKEIQSFNKNENEENYLKKTRELKNFDMYDIEYHEDYDFLKRNVYFDSEKDTEKVKLYYENKYRKFFYKALFYLFFIIVLIIIFLLNILAPWNFNILHSFGNAFNSTQEIIDKINKNNEKFLSWDILIPIKQINSIENVRNFTFNEIQNFFEKKITNNDEIRYAFLKYNYLVGNKILVTIKRQKSSEREKKINKNVSIREEENLALKYLRNENKSYFFINDNVETIYFQWNKYLTYKKYGGYNFELDINTKYSDNFQKELINEYTNYVIIEFFLQNYEYQIIQHVIIKFTFDYGSYFKSNFNTNFLKYKVINKPLDSLKIFFEILYVFLFIGIIFLFLKSIKEDNLSYNKWIRDIITPLNVKIRDIRNKIEPEFLRKFQAIFGIQQVFEVIIIGLSIGIFYTIIYNTILENKLNKIITNKEFDKIYKIRDILYEGENMKNIFEICGIVNIFLSCIKMFSLINLGKFFSIVIKTFEHSKGNIIVFILIIIIIHPSFVFYSHLAFGENDNDFYKIDKTILTCLQAFFGYIDYKQLYYDDKSFGPIFFFIYLIFINLILLNLFVSILYTSYILVKQEIVRRIEIWDPINVFFVCKRRKINFINKTTIQSEFEPEKNDNKIKTNMLIYNRKFSYNDFLKNEKEQINLINDTAFNLKKRRKNARLSYDRKKIGKIYVFDDNLYQNIKKEHLRAFTIDEYFNMLNICEELENDIIQIDNAIEHLQKHDQIMKYETLIQNITQKNMMIKKRTQKLDEDFIKLYNDLKQINVNNLDIEDKKLRHMYSQLNNDEKSDSIIQNFGSELDEQKNDKKKGDDLKEV